MQQGLKRKAETPLIALSRRDERILRTIHYYRYMTVLDVAHLLFSVTSVSYVTRMLTRLAGNGDHQPNHYLYRFALPSATRGNTERVFTLGAKGRDYLQSAGLPVEWFFRPEKTKHIGYGQLIHDLLLTRFLVCAHEWQKAQERIKLTHVRIHYELPRLAVIPDAWLLFAEKGEKIPVLLEIDRGTEYQVRFKQHISDRIAFIRSGEYQKLFQEKSVTVAYLTTGDSLEYRQARLRAMREWTLEVLTEQGLHKWASVFHFAEVAFDRVYETPLFDGPVWYRPDEAKPYTLLA